MSEHVDQIKKYLTMVSDLMPPRFDILSPQHFLLRHGVAYTVTDQTYLGPRGQPKQCYMNATHDAFRNKDRRYVEGMITVHGIPIDHAWTVDDNGQVFDPTIEPNDYVHGYFGVPFSTAYLQKATLSNKVYGLIGYASKSAIKLLQGRVTDWGFPCPT